MVVVPAVAFGGGVGVEVTRGLEGEALRLASTKGDLSRVQYLLQEGASVNLTDEFGYTALQRAASEGHLDIVRLLIKHKAIIDHQDDQHGNTALHEAAWKGYSQTAEALVRAKANVYIKNKGGFAPLHLTCQNSHNQTCRILLLAGCKPDIKNNYGDTPLHTAARYGHAGVSRILISGKANVNEVNKNNDTALHIAVAMNRKKLTKILLESATDQAIRNKQHETPEMICLRKGFDQILETLRNPPPVVPHEERVQQEHEQKRKERKETKEVTFKDFIDEGKGGGGKGEKKSDKKREKTNGSGTSSKDSSTRTKDKKKHKYEHKEKHRGRQVSWSPYGCQYYPPMPTQDLPDTPNLETLPKDPLDTGEQYYIDLAGNIRKGPLGVGNPCHCTPFIKDAKTKLEKDKFALMDHIDCANGKLDAKISDLERRAESHLQHICHNVKQIAKGKEDRKKRGEISSSGHKPQEILQRSEQLRQWAEHQLAASSSFQYMYNPRPYVAGPPSRSRDPMSGFLPLTRSWSEEAVSEYRDDVESGRFSSYKGLKVLDHPTSMYNITKCLNDERDDMSEYRRPIPSLIPGSYRCPSPDGCQSRITDKSWRLATPLSRRRESRSNSVDFSDLLDEPYGPFKFDSSVKLLALFPPKNDLVKESTDSGASTSGRESGGNRSMNTSSNRCSTVAGHKKPLLDVHTSKSNKLVREVPVNVHASKNNKLVREVPVNASKNNKLVREVPGNVPAYSTGLKTTGSGKVRVETGAIPKGTTPRDLPPPEADASKYKVPQRDKAYSPCKFRSTSTVAHGGQPTLVSNLSEYNYSKINDEMNQRYNITPERRQPERIYESYSRPPPSGNLETDLDLDRRRMQQAAQRLYNGYFAKGHLEPMRRTGRPPLSPFKERDSQNDSGYSARVSSSSSQEPSPTFSG